MLSAYCDHCNPVKRQTLGKEEFASSFVLTTRKKICEICNMLKRAFGDDLMIRTLTVELYLLWGDGWVSDRIPGNWLRSSLVVTNLPPPNNLPLVSTLNIAWNLTLILLVRQSPCRKISPWSGIINYILVKGTWDRIVPSSLVRYIFIVHFVATFWRRYEVLFRIIYIYIYICVCVCVCVCVWNGAEFSGTKLWQCFAQALFVRQWVFFVIWFNF